MTYKSKKGQVTLFVIIGIIILIAAGIFFTLRIMFQQPSEQQIISRISEMPVEFQPINDFVESCIAKTGKDGIKAIGFHGGYIDLNRYGIKANSLNPTESRAILFNPKDEDSGVAYWHYFKSDNECEYNCECGSEQPFLYKKQGSPNIETQLEDYVDEKLEECLDEFRVFEQQGFDVKVLSDVETTVNVRNNDVLFYVQYKIEAKKDEIEFEIDEFIKSVPVELEKIYELAEQIRTNEVSFTYLERWTIEQIAGFGLGTNENKLPPIAAAELDPGEKPVYWVKGDVGEDIKQNMLPIYTPFFTVFNTANYNFDLTGTFYEKAILPIASPSKKDYSNLEVKFNYFNWWPIYFDITGRGITGQRIGPETASSSFFSFIGLKRYNFYYDLSYPVLVDVYSPEAFNDEGLHFYVAFEANLRNNNPLKCEGPGKTIYAEPSASLFCNYNQGCSNVTIETVDVGTGNALDGVVVYYSSGLESCDKGFTEISGGRAVLETSLPQCVGSACSINAVKDGYWHYPETYAVRCGKRTNACSNDDVLCNGESLKLSMEPYRTNNIIVMKKKMLKQDAKTWVFNNVAEDLSDNEYAMITLEKIKEHSDEEDLVAAGIFYGNQTSINLYPGLVPGEYKLRIDLFYEFPDYKQRNGVVFNAVEECEEGECFTIGPYDFNETMVEGGFAANVSITKNMLDNYENLIFYTLSSPDIDSAYSILDAYDLEEMAKVEEYSSLYKVQLEPTVS